MNQSLQVLIDWVRETTDVAAGRGVLVPVSGGSDSALCFWICARALPPGHAIAAYVGDLDKLRRRAWFEDVGPVRSLAQPRAESGVDLEILRWGSLLSCARKNKCWLAGSRTRTETVFGTYSLASRLATYLPLVGLWKSEVMRLCDEVGVPREITESSRVADPECERPPEMAAVPFEDVDLFLQVQIGERPAADLHRMDLRQLNYLNDVYRHNQFKANLPLRPRPFTAAS